jgi:dTDP-glucose 4,6-dehydratase
MAEADDVVRSPGAILVTGGAGFIGSNFIRYLLKKSEFRGRVVNLDKLTYAGNLENLAEIDEEYGGKRYFFEEGDICDSDRVKRILAAFPVDTVVHFAAESHVDRSIHGPADFIRTNILGTFWLLESIREYWKDQNSVLFYHVSTDEVYGSLGESGYFYENNPYNPRSPYSASKASADHLVRAYHHTYGIPVVLSNCSNNYGPFQFPEKLIPLMILKAAAGEALPVYGDGKNVRDWLFVEDHCRAIWSIMQKGRLGETYNIGGENEKTNIEIVNQICDTLEKLFPLGSNRAVRNTRPEIKAYNDLVTFVKDRPGHDRRYAVNCDKIKGELGWRPSVDFNEGLEITIDWYLTHADWVDRIRSGEYMKWMERNYGKRGR